MAAMLQFYTAKGDKFVKLGNHTWHIIAWFDFVGKSRKVQVAFAQLFGISGDIIPEYFSDIPTIAISEKRKVPGGFLFTIWDTRFCKYAEFTAKEPVPLLFVAPNKEGVLGLIHMFLQNTVGLKYDIIEDTTRYIKTEVKWLSNRSSRDVLAAGLFDPSWWTLKRVEEA
jgi:hypothetical protein